jgi:hypothetical protein
MEEAARTNLVRCTPEGSNKRRNGFVAEDVQFFRLPPLYSFFSASFSLTPKMEAMPSSGTSIDL